MNNIIIFSHCKLIQLSLQKLAEETFENNGISAGSYHIQPCSTYDKLIDLLNTKINIICFFDINNVSSTEIIIIFDEITKHFGNAALLVLHTEANTNAFLGRRHQNPLYMLDMGSNLIDFKHLLLLTMNSIKEIGDNIDNQRKHQVKKSKLTVREQEVLNFILCGMNNIEISIHLGVSDKTISGYRRGIYNKYHVDNVAGLYYMINYAS